MDENKNIVRIGIVSSVDTDNLMVRVFYPQFDNLVSGWLPVLQMPTSISINASGNHSHSGSAGSAGAHTHNGEISSDGLHEHPITIDNNGSHAHEATVLNWMPSIDDSVLVLYIQGFSMDGFVLGVIK